VTSERWAQIRQIFEGVLERSEADRAAYLRITCARDEELRREVEGLLQSHERSGDFLDTPAAEVGKGQFNVTQFGTQIAAGAQFVTGQFSNDPGEYKPGYRVGPYQLERRIGRGGMGSVWLATRVDQEFKMNVAVKLVKPGMDTQEILRRFRLERQVLAGLEHTNIARLIDGGSTPEGLPYLVMEYVEGTPIDQYCDARKVSVSDRLKLFRDVCAAVQYAHQNLVVHRDIKTGNILVTQDGTPKLLDFGIAKLVRSEFSTLSAAETRPEMRPMTLDYASPEQVRGDPITTATDVYSLGVLLYKMLTGKFPYGPQVRSFVALQQAICEVDPIKPSAVILTDERTVIPQATQKIEIGEETRTTARARLKRKLAGDLDTIILKALRKEPLKRYASVEQFSEDVRRYLEGRPVIARSDTFGYRTGKFVRRNLAWVAVAAVLFVALAVNTVIATRYARQAGQQRALAEEQLRAAQIRNVAASRDLMSAEIELARIRELALGQPGEALLDYRKALENARALVQDRPQDAEARRTLAHAAEKIAALAPSEAVTRYAEAATQREILAQEAGGGPGAQREWIAALRRLGMAQFRSRDFLAALATFSRALQTAETLAVVDPQVRPDAAACNLAVAEVLERNGATDAALAKFRKALDLYRQLARVPQTPVSGQAPADYERVLHEVASAAPADAGKELEADLAAFRQ
jgi:serine/threonine protein kinase